MIHPRIAFDTSGCDQKGHVARKALRRKTHGDESKEVFLPSVDWTLLVHAGISIAVVNCRIAEERAEWMDASYRLQVRVTELDKRFVDADDGIDSDQMD